AGLAVLHAVLVMVMADFGGDAAVYGVAAGLISGLLATYIAIYIILLGAVINAALATDGNR
ncbi:MAG: YihY/virulence factor BrkB family protein, partial [Actinomycetes bacterium]